MHARLDHLLSLRDGEPVDASVREHVASCGECAAKLADTATLQARLRALPSIQSSEPDGFASVLRRRALADRGAVASRRAARMAVAAAVASIAFGVAWRLGDDRVAAPRPTQAALTPAAAEEALARDRVAQLQTRSAALEEALTAIGRHPAVERAGAALPIDTLEAQVQWIDHQLLASRDARAAEPLWRERVAAMDSLVRLRYVEAQRVAAL